jgi:signal transduction histidine kinase/CheY-like chemotaxis protein/HAMP domain-containing protein
MKISFRILLINFVTVVLILSSATIAFYSIMYEILTNQQSKQLINSANNFIYIYRSGLMESEDEFLSLPPNDLEGYLTSGRLNTSNIDFIFELSDKNPNDIERISSNKKIYMPEKKFGVKDFLEYNPYVVTLKQTEPDGQTYLFGKVLSNQILDEFAKKINSDVALIWKGIPADVSNSSINQKYLYVLTKASENLKSKNNFEIYTEGTESNDLLATIYSPGGGVEPANNFSFLIFTTIGGAAELRGTLKDVFIVIGFAGVALSLILTLLFTEKLRKQITQLSKATTIISAGDFKNKITISSKDEIGKLGMAFNSMLDELEKKERAKNEYSEFITLINQNPTLTEISEAALNKIISTGNFIFGALYSVEDKDLVLIKSLGISSSDGENLSNFGFYDRVVLNKETIEINSDEKLPVVSAGIVNIEIKHLSVIPIIYNEKTTAVLVLGSVNSPTEEVKDYLSKIKEQLAIGIINAKALVQLENFIDELKNLNDEYQKQNEKIKKQNDKLLELHNELKEKANELEIQKLKAEEATKLKSQFLASMSHELRTPMNSILGLTELIIEKAEMNGKNKERLEVVLSSGRRLMTLINDILDLSKIEAGKMEIRDEDVLLEELIEEVSNSVNPLVIKKGIGFSVVRNLNTRIIIHTDRGKIVQVLINLVGNAVKFTDEGEVSLHISMDKEKLRFDVSDTGIGIPEEEQKIIFEEFRQVDGSTTRKYGGTGLGLAICRRIIDLLGGEIWLKSEQEKGSIFSFTIPLQFVQKQHKEPVQKVNVGKLIENRAHPILIIDDDEEVRYTIGQYLISKGYEVIFAEDGDKGLKMAIEQQPFAITLDVMLPQKDGWSILKELKENPTTKDIPVILISIMGDKNIGYGLGAFEYFVKPISSEKLLSAFSQLENLAKKQIQKIVIVDDDELEFEKFRREFKDDRIRIEYIKDSEYAFSKISEVQPDLIILDLMMPKIDGVTLSYKLKTNSKTKHIPILISTAKDLTEEERKSLNNIVEDIAVKSKGHPLDVLKVVRDRIRMQELQQPIIQAEQVVEEKYSEKPADEKPQQVAESRSSLAEIMIVDDDPDTLFTLDEIVQSANCSTILAKNGKECLELLEKKIPDLILLDIMMPVMDGFQTISKIRGNAKWADIPVFAVTAKAMSGDKEVILKHGFNDYIPKPVNAKIISFKIGQLLSQLKSI